MGRLQEINDRQKAEDVGFCFLLGNVDFYNYTYYFQKKIRATAELIKTIVRSGKYPLLQESHFENRLMSSSVVKFRANPVYRVTSDNQQTCTEGLFRLLHNRCFKLLRNIFRKHLLLLF